MKTKGKLFIFLFLFLFILFFFYQSNRPQKENFEEIQTTLLQFLDASKVSQLINYEVEFQGKTSLHFDSSFISDKILTEALFLSNITSQDHYDAKKVEQYFQKNFHLTLKHHDIICEVDGKTLYHYDKEKKIYQFTGTHLHGNTSGAIPFYRKVYTMKKKKDSYLLLTTELYQEENFIYADPQKKVKLEEYSSFIDSNQQINASKIIEEYNASYEKKKDSYPKMQYTFQKEKDTFYLTDYQILD